MRMLFLYRGWNSGTNQAILQAWQAGFPELQIGTYDVCPLVWTNPKRRLTALPHALRRGGPLIFRRGTGRFTDAVKRTKWCMEQVVAQVGRVQQHDLFDFSLSIGSVLPVFNSSKPVFIYTDSTILANRYYPDGEEWVRLWRKCLPYEIQSLHHAMMVFTMSDHVSRSLIEQYGLPPEKVLRVNGGCNIPSVSNPDPHRFEYQRILFIGVDWERKGGPELLKAFAKVYKHHPHATLTIIGCQPKIREPGVRVVGFVPQQIVTSYLERSTLFCMPSKREPFGIAYLEAMHAGLPIIASNLGAAPDFVINGENGYTVDPKNIDQLAQRIEDLITNPAKCARMGSNARALVQSQYSWDRTQREMWKAIKKYLN